MIDKYEAPPGYVAIKSTGRCGDCDFSIGAECGTAFPCTAHDRGDGKTVRFKAMKAPNKEKKRSLRDDVAAEAMKILLAYDLGAPIEKNRGMDWVSEQAYKMADAMMEARKGGAK